MINKKYKKGLTLIELLVALIVTSIVLTAVVTLACALDTVNDVTDETSKKQAQIRFATVRISDLIRHCKLICGTPGGELAVWRADDGDGQININELVYIERGTGNNYLRLCEFPLNDTSPVTLSDIATLSTSGYDVRYVPLIPECSNVMFYLDDTILPPKSRFVTISYDVIENGIPRQCQINATLRGWAGNLLDASGSSIVSDDD
jgi:prepilin-type N-terminal cleavage/methylation domain-containing protein